MEKRVNCTLVFIDKKVLAAALLASNSRVIGQMLCSIHVCHGSRDVLCVAEVSHDAAPVEHSNLIPDGATINCC